MLNRHINTFIEVAGCGSFSKAAEKLFVSASAVIQQMNLLEAEVGVKLFMRTSRGVELTEAGNSFYSDMLSIQKAEEKAVRKARMLGGKQRQLIRVATSAMSTCRLMYRIIAEYTSENPDVEFQFVNRPVSSLQGKFDEKAASDFTEKYDILENVIYTASYDGLCGYTVLFDVPLVCAVPVSNELCHKSHLAVEDLYTEKLALMSENTSYEVNMLRDWLTKEHPCVKICDVPNMLPGTLSECAVRNQIVVVPSIWTDCMPGFRLIPTKWEFTIPYGFVYAPDPPELVHDLIEKAKQMDLKL